MARAKIPDIHPCVVESLIDTANSNAFRMGLPTANGTTRSAITASISQGEKVAVIGDTNGLWRDRGRRLGDGVQEGRRDVVYQANIDSTSPT